MSKKVGRPRLTKTEAKGVLIGARLTPPEARRVIEAARKANKIKSEWVRIALLSAATT